MMCRAVAALPFAILAGSAPAQPAVATEATKLEWLHGRWTGKGTSLGQPAEAELKVGAALGGKFLEFDYRLSTTGRRPSHFQGRAFYKLAAPGHWTATWFDSRGASLAITAVAKGGVLTSDWSGSEKGQTIYRLIEGGQLEVVDKVVRSDGAAREFARIRYAKAP